MTRDGSDKVQVVHAARGLIVGGAILTAVAIAPLTVAKPNFFQPDSATASSEWSSLYRVAYTIDGSGLPPDFGPTDPHSNYVGNNHWTTGDGDVVGAWARFAFDEPAAIDTFWMWNHRSTVPPAFSEFYAVRRFDLQFFDASEQLIGEFLNLSAERNVTTAQVYRFPLMTGVRSVRLTVRENHGEPRVTGLAEVAFGRSLSLQADGTCPGTVTVEWDGATPNRQAGLVFSARQGSFTISGGPCDGTQLGLGTNQLQLVRTLSTGATGSGRLSGNAGAGACGGFLQLVVADGSPCTTSNVAQIP
jgi:hypothetical protein